MSSATKDKRVRVTNYGPKNWRTEVLSDGEWYITGPAYATKTEALLHVDTAISVNF